MKYRAEIDIMPHAELLDPQGKTVAKNLKNVHIDGVEQVRIGKHVSVKFEARDEQAARELVEKACKDLLANVIMEGFTYSLTEEN